METDHDATLGAELLKFKKLVSDYRTAVLDADKDQTATYAALVKTYTTACKRVEELRVQIRPPVRRPLPDCDCQECAAARRLIALLPKETTDEEA